MWFAKDSNHQLALRLEIGLDYDKSLSKKYNFMHETLPEHNGGMCKVMYMDFDDDDEELKAMSLSCGHQFSTIAW